MAKAGSQRTAARRARYPHSYLRDLRAPSLQLRRGALQSRTNDALTEVERRAAAGDLPNITVSPRGEVKTEIVNKNVTLKQFETNSLFKEQGTSIVIHAQAHDTLP